MVGLLLVACVTAEACYGLPDAPPPPEWATPRWIRDAAGIVAGESVPGCNPCDLWIACTVVEDVTLRGYHPWRLRPTEVGKPGRWHGWREPGEQHLTAVAKALGAGGCLEVPTCAYLGSLNDYAGNWRFGLARERRVLAVGNSAGVVVCIPAGSN